jgi:hypothetical protein
MYLGNQPALAYTSLAKQDFTTSATTSYVLDNPVANANELALFINFVRQEPTTAYTASGTTLTLTSATSATDDMYCVFLGKAVQTVNPPAGSVGASQIADGSIALGKLSATGTKDSTTFLRGDNSFATIASGLTEVDMWRQTTNTGIGSGAVRNGILSNWERADTYSFAKIGTGMSESSGVFTFSSTGTYLVQFNAMAYIGNNTMRAVNVDIIYSSDNGSSYNIVCNSEFNTFNSSNNTHGSATSSYIFNITNTTNEKLKFGVWEQEGKSGTLQGDTSSNITYVIFMKLG